jgi:exosome complex component RRP43
MTTSASSSQKEVVENFSRLHPREFHARFHAHGVRPDGRPLEKLRKLAVAPGGLACLGSSLAKVGATSVAVGIRPSVVTEMEGGGPLRGNVVVRLELGAVCSSEYPLGKPSDRASALTFLLQNMVDAGMVDRDALVVDEGKAAWVLQADVYCLNDTGNVVDCAILGLQAALRSTTLPRLDKDLVTGAYSAQWPAAEGGMRVPLRRLVVPLTLCVFDGKLISDPTAEEETLACNTITVAVDHEGVLVKVSKAGGAPVARDTMEEAVQRTRERISDVTAILDNLRAL